MGSLIPAWETHTRKRPSASSIRARSSQKEANIKTQLPPLCWTPWWQGLHSNTDSLVQPSPDNTTQALIQSQWITTSRFEWDMAHLVKPLIASGLGLDDANPLCRNGDSTRMDRQRANVGMNRAWHTCWSTPSCHNRVPMKTWNSSTPELDPAPSIGRESCRWLEKKKHISNTRRSFFFIISVTFGAFLVICLIMLLLDYCNSLFSYNIPLRTCTNCLAREISTNYKLFSFFFLSSLPRKFNLYIGPWQISYRVLIFKTCSPTLSYHAGPRS